MGNNKKKYQSKTLYDLLFEIARTAAHNEEKATKYHLLYAFAVVVNMSMKELADIFGEDVKKLERVEYTVQKIKFFMEQGDNTKVNPKLIEAVLPSFFKQMEARAYYKDSLNNFQSFCESNIVASYGNADYDEEIVNMVFGLLVKGYENEKTGEFMPPVSNFYLKNLPLSLRKLPLKLSNLPDVSDTSDKESIYETIAISKEMEKNLCKKVIGQDAAIQTFLAQYVQSRLIGNAPNKPKATFLFAGPPGVGKTFLAQGVAEELDIPYKRFDMSEYSGDGKDSVDGLIGFAQTYKDAVPGVLTKFVAENPTCILLFDEIEKASSPVLKLFLQVLDGARLTDKYTEEAVSFEDAILIFTTNAGKNLYDENDNDLSSIPTNEVVNALREDVSFPKELVSRFASGNIVMFNNLHSHHLMELAMRGFQEIANTMRKEHGFDVRYDWKMAELFMLHKVGGMDARMVSSQSRKFMTDGLHGLLRSEINASGKDSVLKKFSFEVEIDEKNKEVHDIFHLTKEFNILFISDKGKAAYSFDKSSIETAKVEMTSTRDGMEELLKQKKYQLIVVDVSAGMPEEAEDKKLLYISSEGNKCRSILSKLAFDTPVYVLDDDAFTAEERKTLQRENMRGFLPVISSADDADGKKEWEQVVNRLHFQNVLRQFQQENKIVSFQTETKIEKGMGVIRFFDLHIEEIIVDSAAERKLDKENLVSDVERPKERFKDVIGAKNAMEELKYFIDYVKHPEKYELMGCGMPKGVLLYGPPGTGKTLLAKATAGECEIPFIPKSASDFLEGPPSAIKELFQRARRHAPVIIFIDEIDSIGQERRNSTNPYLNTLLTEMDGFSGRGKKPVFVIAASNFDIDGTKSGKAVKLDPALSRRFGSQIYVDLPSREERKHYIEMLLEKKGQRKYVEDGAIASFAELMLGASCSKLENIIEYALRKCAMSGRTRLTGALLLDYMNEFVYGEKRERRNEELYKSTAYHEAGHAFVMWKEGDMPSFMTIVARGDYNGFVNAKEDDKDKYTEADYRKRIRISLAGRASEMAYYEKMGEDNKQGINTGAGMDLETATRHAKAIVSRFGMQENRLVVIPEKEMPESMISENLNKANDILLEEFEKTKKMITDNFDVVERLAQGAIAYTQLNESQILTLLEGEGLSEKKEAKPKKYYVVNAGYHPGIYESWAECQRQIYKYSGAKYKSYPNLEEALKGFVYKYYVIKDGDNVGIYDDWKKYRDILKSEEDPVCAIFKNREAAEQYLNAPLEVYYVVKRGKKPGIYRTWKECKEALGDGEDTVFKKFSTLIEAEEFFHNN